MCTYGITCLFFPITYCCARRTCDSATLMYFLAEGQCPFWLKVTINMIAERSEAYDRDLWARNVS